MIDSLRGLGIAALVVDAGDFTHPDSARDDRYNRFVLRGFEAMGYGAMTLGELDLYRGSRYIESVLDSTRVPITLANARFAGSGQPVGERFVLHQAGGVTFGVIGLLGQDFGDGQAMSRFKEAGFTVDDPFETAARLVPEVKSKADVVVVLAHLTVAAARDLARRVQEIDVLILGHHVAAAPPVQLRGDSQPPAVEVAPTAFVDSLGPVRVASGERGQYLAKTRIILDPSSRRILAYGGAATGLTLRDFPDRGDLAAALLKLHETVNAERKRVELIEDLKLAERRLVTGQDHFLGDLKCARCHFDIYKGWQSTQHAGAWETLVEKKRDADPECVSCHVTGLELPGGYKGVGAVQDMRNVQCESCHGMGTFHDFAGLSDSEAGEPTCIRCHTAENSPEFDFRTYWPRIEH